MKFLFVFYFSAFINLIVYRCWLLNIIFYQLICSNKDNIINLLLNIYFFFSIVIRKTSIIKDVKD